MTKATARDAVWNYALRRALQGDSFTLEHARNTLASDAPSDRTMRDVFNTLVEYDWLAKDSPKAHRWRPGPLARQATDPTTRRDDKRWPIL